MRKLLSILFFLFFVTTLFSQTKLISHRSHSGKESNFTKIFENNMFNISDSNMGLAPMHLFKKTKLDSVIYITEVKSVIVMRQECPKKEGSGKTEMDWCTRSDTLYNHPVYSRKNISEAELKINLLRQFQVVSDINSVVFTGYNHREKIKIDCLEKEQKQFVWFALFKAQGGALLYGLLLILAMVGYLFMVKIEFSENNTPFNE